MGLNDVSKSLSKSWLDDSAKRKSFCEIHCHGYSARDSYTIQITVRPVELEKLSSMKSFPRSVTNGFKVDIGIPRILT